MKLVIVHMGVVHDVLDDIEGYNLDKPAARSDVIAAIRESVQVITGTAPTHDCACMATFRDADGAECLCLCFDPVSRDSDDARCLPCRHGSHLSAPGAERQPPQVD